MAIVFEGLTWALPAPNRHHDVIRLIVENTGKQVRNDVQGFLDASGRFLNRKQALVSAEVNGQLKDPDGIRCGQLFSEDVW